MPTMTNKQENEKTKQEVLELFELENKYKKIKQQYEDKKKKLSVSIKNFMFANNWGNFSFNAPKGIVEDPGKIVVKKIQSKKIIWDVEKMEEKLDPELINEIVVKDYKITDMDNLVKYLKECGVSPKKFKNFISVEKSVDKKKLDFLFETGEIKTSDLDGCYDLKESESYLKIDMLLEE